MAGSIGSMTVETDAAGTLRSDEISFLEKVVLADLNDPECRPDKLKRAFSLGELYAIEMPLAMTGQFFKAATDVLQNDSYGIDTRIDAARAADNWIRMAKDVDEYDEPEFTERKIPLIPHVPAYFKGLLMVGRKSLSKGDVTVILDNVDNALRIDDEAAKSVLSELLSFNIATFIKFHDDTEICQTCEWMFRTLGETVAEWPDACEESILASGLLPVLANMMITNAVNMPKRKDAEESISRALGVLNTVLNEFWFHVEPPSRLISETAYSVFHCLLPTSGDNYIHLWPGYRIISHFLEGSGQIIINQKYDNGKTGPEYILEVAARMLKVDNPIKFRATCMVEILLSKLRGANKKLELAVFGKSLDILFEAVLSELREPNISSETEKYLLMIYAHFMTTECEVVLDFLSGAADGPTGQSALAFVIADGFCRDTCERFSADDRQVVKAALRKALEYSRKLSDSELDEINPKGAENGTSATDICLISEIRRTLEGWRRK